MGLVVKPNTFSPGATIIAAEHNSNNDTIYNSHNGNITNANINASAAILESKLDFDDTTGHNHDGATNNGTKVDLSAPNVIGDTTPAAITGTVVEATTSLAITGTGDDAVVITGIKDEDAMTSDSATHVATQQSIKKYVDDSTVLPSAKASFLAQAATTQLNIALATDVTVILGTEVYDVGSNFATNTFTAPQTGKYILTASVAMTSFDSAATSYTMKIITSNRTYLSVLDGKALSADGAQTMNIVVVADMDASDTAYVTMLQTAGTQQTDITGGLGTYFSGSLI